MKKRDISDAQVKNVYLSIGSNLGNRIHFLEKSKYLLETHDIKIVKTSSYYETESWPDPSFPKFINATFFAPSLDNFLVKYLVSIPVIPGVLCLFKKTSKSFSALQLE